MSSACLSWVQAHFPTEETQDCTRSQVWGSLQESSEINLWATLILISEAKGVLLCSMGGPVVVCWFRCSPSLCRRWHKSWQNPSPQTGGTSSMNLTPQKQCRQLQTTCFLLDQGSDALTLDIVGFLGRGQGEWKSGEVTRVLFPKLVRGWPNLERGLASGSWRW